MTLPVELLSFTAKTSNENALLQWKTATETNNRGWNIQRSLNGFSWNTIAFVSGAGNSTDNQSYAYVDKTSEQGRAFYRLEQVDFDGSKAYSSVVTVYISYNKMSVYPTITSDFLNVNGMEEASSYTIVDANGKGLLNGIIQPSERIRVSNLNSGIYFLQINDVVFKFIKN
ncbi:MAG: T9SS type A sorting domain-containing protein [Saprospiraceae bacterium]